MTAGAGSGVLEHLPVLVFLAEPAILVPELSADLFIREKQYIVFLVRWTDATIRTATEHAIDL
jgi:hypothetical protein